MNASRDGQGRIAVVCGTRGRPGSGNGSEPVTENAAPRRDRQGRVVMALIAGVLVVLSRWASAAPPVEKRDDPVSPEGTPRAAAESVDLQKLETIWIGVQAEPAERAAARLLKASLETACNISLQISPLLPPEQSSGIVVGRALARLDATQFDTNGHK